MNKIFFAKGTTAEDLRIFLAFWSQLFAEAKEARQGMVEDKEKILGNDALPFSWCYLYELPIKEHVALALTSITQNFDGMLGIFKKALRCMPCRSWAGGLRR